MRTEYTDKRKTNGKQKEGQEWEVRNRDGSGMDEETVREQQDGKKGEDRR